VKDEGPEGSVPRSKGKAGGPRPQEDAELMPQREVLGHECGPRAKEGDEGPQEESNQAKHAERIRAENEPEEGRSEERRNLNRLRYVRPHSDTLWDSGEAHRILFERKRLRGLRPGMLKSATPLVDAAPGTLELAGQAASETVPPRIESCRPS
jgi:hypothetical protein